MTAGASFQLLLGSENIIRVLDRDKFRRVIENAFATGNTSNRISQTTWYEIGTIYGYINELQVLNLPLFIFPITNPNLVLMREYAIL